MSIYLDNAATTRLDGAVRSAMEPWLGEIFGNPSSRHPKGVQAREAVDSARRDVARALGGRPDDLTFTAGGTEANNLAVLGIARARKARGRHILIGPTEHPSVQRAAEALAGEGFEIETGKLSAGGKLDLEDLLARLRPDTVLVAQMMVNNELGTHYPVSQLARQVAARAPGAAVHVDAVQALGKYPVYLDELGVHSLAVSSHKIHGPMGMGALITRPDIELTPIVYGGNQESGRRSGTENVAGIVGFGAAARMAEQGMEQAAQAMLAAREAFCAGVERIEGVRVLAGTGSTASESSPSILALLVPGPAADIWSNHLEERGVLVSTGSACQARKSEISTGLLAFGLSEEQARRVLRISFSRMTSLEDVDGALRKLETVCSQLEALKD